MTTLETALAIRKLGWRPVVIAAGGKNPVDKDWGNKQLTEDEIRRRYGNTPALNVGVKLGPDSGVIDIEGDGDGWQAGITELFGDDPPRTPSFKSRRGEHYLFAYDVRLAGVTTLKIGPVEIRVGSNSAQSLLPPSTTDGFTRQWLVGLDCPLAVLPDGVIEKILAAAPKPAMPRLAAFDLDDAEYAALEKSLAGYMDSVGFKATPRRDDDRTFFDLAYCPRKGPQHTDGRTSVILHGDGSIVLKCFHAKCADESPGDAWRRFQRDRDATFADWQIDLTSLDARTDAANARRFVNRFRDAIRYCPKWKAFLTWDGRRWTQNATAIEALAKEYAHSLWQPARRLLGTVDDKLHREVVAFVRATNGANGIANLLTMARSEPGISIEPSELDADPLLLNVENGTVDLRTCEMRAHSKADYLTNLAPVVFNAEAKCPTWESFLKEIFADSADDIAFLQRWLGYCLTGSTVEQKFVICHGTGANGKSTLVETIMALLGDFAFKAPSKIFMARRGEHHPTERASLFGKRAVFINETDEGACIDEASIKELTGGDRVTARRLYENFWTFEATHKITMATNYAPAIRGRDHAIWRRVVLLPFDVVIPPDKQDPHLLAKLKLESSGILNWCIAGCMAWQAAKLAPPKRAVDATAAYREREDDFAGFLAECCDQGADLDAGASELLEAFNRYTSRRTDRKVFAKLLETKGFKSDMASAGPHKGRIRWQGLALKATVESRE